VNAITAARDSRVVALGVVAMVIEAPQKGHDVASLRT
jgi:hypothetical protein